MSPNKYTGPLAPGMLFLAVGDAPAVRAVNVPGFVPGDDSDAIEVGAGVDEAGWFTVCCDDTEPYAQPEWSDGATVGALAGVVRKLYNEPRLSAIYIDWTPLSDDKGWTLGWYEFHSGCGALVFVTCLGRMGPAPTEADAWLAAYHAHRDGGAS